MSTAPSSTTSDALHGLRVAFVGRLAGMPKREAQQLVRAHGGIPVEAVAGADLIVVADQSPPLALADVLEQSDQTALEEGRLVALAETQLWQQLGLIDHDPSVTRMYTPAMLAELLGVPVAKIRRWHENGLLHSSKQVGRLAHFDFAAVATARQLATLTAAGASQRQIEKQFAALARWFPEAAAQSSLLVHGKKLLVRQGDDLLEAGGQQRFDFDERSADEAEAHTDEPSKSVLSLDAGPPAAPAIVGPAEMIESAHALEESGQLEHAAEMYRAALAAGGPHPESCFALAELLYRLGDVAAARERYYMAIELDENFVEARANLGCVLAETGQLDLAVSAFEGALAFHHDFPDAHYHLARVLDELGREGEALAHWRQFLELAPDSPWAAAARTRLSAD